MDFEILLEGTMIGAELNALSEAEIVISKDLKSGDEFADTVINAFKAQLEEMSKVRKAIQEAVKENINRVSKNREKIIELLQSESTYNTRGSSNISIDKIIGAGGFAFKFTKTIKKTFTTINADKEIKQETLASINQLERLINKANNTMSARDAYDVIIDTLKAMYKVGTELNRTLGEIKANFNPTVPNSPIKKWRSNLVEAFGAANRSAGSQFDVSRVTTKARDVVSEALSSAKATIDEMTKVINNSGARTLFDAYNQLAIKWNDEVVKSSLGQAIGATQMPYMKPNNGKIVIPTPKEVETAKKQSESALDKVKGKISDLIEKLKSQINDPSIATVAVSVVVAIATYLVFYGAVKAAGGKVGSPVAISTTFKAAATVVKEATFGKKLLIIALFGVVSAAFVAAGTVGFKFIKNKLAR